MKHSTAPLDPRMRRQVEALRRYLREPKELSAVRGYHNSIIQSRQINVAATIGHWLARLAFRNELSKGLGDVGTRTEAGDPACPQ